MPQIVCAILISVIRKIHMLKTTLQPGILTAPKIYHEHIKFSKIINTLCTSHKFLYFVGMCKEACCLMNPSSGSNLVS